MKSKVRTASPLPKKINFKGIVHRVYTYMYTQHKRRMYIHETVNNVLGTRISSGDAKRGKKICSQGALSQLHTGYMYIYMYIFLSSNVWF